RKTASLALAVWFSGTNAVVVNDHGRWRQTVTVVFSSLSSPRRRATFRSRRYSQGRPLAASSLTSRSAERSTTGCTGCVRSADCPEESCCAFSDKRPGARAAAIVAALHFRKCLRGKSSFSFCMPLFLRTDALGRHRGVPLLVHDEKRAEAMEVVGVAPAVEIELQVAHVGAFADSGQIGEPVGAERDPAEHAAITLLRN